MGIKSFDIGNVSGFDNFTSSMNTSDNIDKLSVTNSYKNDIKNSNIDINYENVETVDIQSEPKQTIIGKIKDSALAGISSLFRSVNSKLFNGMYKESYSGHISHLKPNNIKITLQETATGVISGFTTIIGFFVNIFNKGNTTNKENISDLTISDGYWNQGMTYNGKEFVMLRIDPTADENSSKKLKLVIMSEDGKDYGEVYMPVKWMTGSTNHANDITYDPVEDCYFVGTNGGKEGDGLFKFRIIKKGKRFTIETIGKVFPDDENRASGIAHDINTDQFYSASGDMITIYDRDKDGNLIEINKFEKDKAHRGGAQGIEAYNGKVLVIRDQDGTSAVDVYDSKTGEYLKTYKVDSAAELESISWSGENDKFYAASNQGGAGSTVDLIELPGISSL